MHWRKWHICTLAKVYIECTTDCMKDAIPYSKDSKLAKAVFELEKMGLVTTQDAYVAGHFITNVTDEGKRIFESIPTIDVVVALDSFRWLIAAKEFILRLSKEELAGFLVHKEDFYKDAALERYEELCSCDCQTPT